MRNRGGVLSKIFNRNQNQGQQPFMNNQASFADSRGIGGGLSGIGGIGSAAGSGSGGLGGLLGGFRNLTSASSLSSMLGNVQGVMKTAESFLPMVQQYGPMVKNLPAMYKIYQALKTDDGETSTSEEKKETKEAGKAEKVLPASKEETEYEEFLDDFAGKQNQGSSRPRLYTQTTRP
ncbi:hypothetical protein AMD01_14230 [Priestia koreensis]|uniref:Spore coat protein n=2 Tax=Priestia koreensis TaxID=284581 RepID=A0A0M0KZ72_9BACI|nr:hypothetical protein AMD01_14230 [Priestia koreensis]